MLRERFFLAADVSFQHLRCHAVLLLKVLHKRSHHVHQRHLRISSESHIALADCCINHIAGNDREDAGAFAAGSLIGYHLIDISGVREGIGPPLCLSNMRNVEYLCFPVVGLQIPAVCHNGGFLCCLLQYLETGIYISPASCQGTGQMDRWSGDDLSSARIFVHGLLRKTGALAILQDSVVGGDFVTGELLGGNHSHLDLLRLPTGRHFRPNRAGHVVLPLKLCDSCSILGLVTHSGCPPES